MNHYLCQKHTALLYQIAMQTEMLEAMIKKLLPQRQKHGYSFLHSRAVMDNPRMEKYRRML